MKWTIQNIARQWILGSISVYIVKIIILRLYAYVYYYATSRALYELALKQVDMCQNQYHIGKLFDGTCKAAEQQINIWPSFIAFKTLLENTYLCIDQPCSEAFATILNSWFWVFFLVVFMLSGSLLLFMKINEYMNRAYVKNLKKQNKQYIDQHKHAQFIEIQEQEEMKNSNFAYQQIDYNNNNNNDLYSGFTGQNDKKIQSLYQKID